MGNVLKRLMSRDFMPHGPCWGWDPWAVGSNVLGDALIALVYILIALNLVFLVRRRGGKRYRRVVLMFAAFISACACTHALDVINTWHGLFRLAGTVKAATALVSLATLIVLVRLTPDFLVAPTLDKALALDAALAFERMGWKDLVEPPPDRYRLLVDGIRDYAIFLLDPSGRIRSWNPGAERITGYSREEALGKDFACVFPGEEVAAGRPGEILRRAAAEGRTEDEGWKVRKDGTRFLANGIITAFRDDQDRLLGFAKVTRDITEQRASRDALESLAESLEDKVRAQVRELRENEGRLQGFIRHVPAAIAFKGLGGEFLHINPGMEALLGLPAREILGRTTEEVLPPELRERAREREQRVLNHRQHLQVEEAWPHGDGTLHHYLSHIFPLVDPQGQCWGLGLMATDITERRKGELALLQSQKLESLGVLAGGIAHDFNNLLGAMQGNVELALAEDSLAEATPHLETLRGLMSKATGLLRQMLAYAGQGRSAVTTLDLNRLLEEMTHLLGTSISKKALIRRDLHPGQAPMEADASQIQQVIMNLVINASEALGEENGVIDIRTRLEHLGQAESAAEGQPLHPGLHVVLEVADNGSGMAPDVLKKIFDPFFTTKFTGRGLGLAALLGIVRGHNGAIRVSSEPGKGSTFRLLFPASREAAQARALEPPLPRGVPEAPDPGAVLVVDDEDAMRRVMVKAMARLGLSSLQARDGREALGLFEEKPEGIILVIMDLTMPNMDGEEACRELRRRGFRVPVILISGFNETVALRRFEDLDLAGFLQKPFALGKLVEMARDILGKG